jgi:coproporphyrinogen III oxidase
MVAAQLKTSEPKRAIQGANENRPQNDLGIMGSLPSHVDRELLRSWAARVEPPQDVLVQRLADTLPDAGPSLVGDEAKLALARGVREFYRQHPRALDLQASGNVAVPTVRNHQ